MKMRSFSTIVIVVMLTIGFLTPYSAAQGRGADPVLAEPEAEAYYRRDLPAPMTGIGQEDPQEETPNAVLYFWDFEGTDGGFNGTLDWEWGTYAWAGGGGCSASAAPPPGAYSGTDMWGTVLNDCYNPLGNNEGYDTCVNGDPTNDSVLSFTVDLTPVSSTAELAWWEWFDLYLNWDWGEVYVNNDVVFQHCGGGYVAPTEWVSQTVDLTPYVGTVVTIKFHMMASSVVNYAGWWIDDVMISGDTTQVPDIVVDAPPLQTDLCPDSTDVITFTICNSGTRDLIWNFDEFTSTAAPVEPATSPAWANSSTPADDVPWFSEDPISGTLAPSLCTAIDVTFDSTGMMPGDYYADLLVQSNDPVDPVITLPVTMTVFEPAAIIAVDVVSDGCGVTLTAFLAGEPPLSWEWDLGAFGIITDINPVFVDFGVSGSYPFTLTAWNACGMEMLTSTVDVACEPCDPPTNLAMSWDPLQPVEGEDVTLTGFAEGTEPLTFSWDFGDGNVGVGITATHAYSPSGDYVVTLTVDNNCGSALITDTITVYTETVCEPVMISDVVAAVDACTVTFTPDLIGEMPFTYSWDFGDGMTSTAAMPTHVYAAPGGTFTVTLEVWNCTGSGHDTYEFTVTTSCEVPSFQIYLPLISKNYGP